MCRLIFGYLVLVVELVEMVVMGTVSFRSSQLFGCGFQARRQLCPQEYPHESRVLLPSHRRQRFHFEVPVLQFRSAVTRWAELHTLKPRTCTGIN